MTKAKETTVGIRKEESPVGVKSEQLSELEVLRQELAKSRAKNDDDEQRISNLEAESAAKDVKLDKARAVVEDDNVTVFSVGKGPEVLARSEFKKKYKASKK